MSHEWENTPGWALGLRQRKGRKRREEIARQMAARGSSDADIAERLNVKVDTVRRYLGKGKGNPPGQRLLW